MKPDLAILYEHPTWFEPLFAALDRRGVRYEAIRLSDHRFDPASHDIPAPVVLSRVAMSSFLREAEHGIFYAEALLAHWAANGARVLNGAGGDRGRFLEGAAALAHLPARLRRAGDPGRASPRGPARGRRGRCAGRCWSRPISAARAPASSATASEEALAASIADGTVPESVDCVLLVQDYVPARGGAITRVETLGGKFLYAIEVESGGDSFDLCPADACLAQPGRAAVRMDGGRLRRPS